MFLCLTRLGVIVDRIKILSDRVTSSQVKRAWEWGCLKTCTCFLNVLLLSTCSLQVIFVALGSMNLTHLFRSVPLNSCRPMSAKTPMKKTVRIMTSDNILIDFIKVFTIAFKPWQKKKQEMCYSALQTVYLWRGYSIGRCCKRWIGFDFFKIFIQHCTTSYKLLKQQWTPPPLKM